MKRIEFICDDLMESILVKLPVKSLIRFKCVSKEWRSLITSHRFSVSHIHKHRNYSFIAAKNKNDVVTFIDYSDDVVLAPKQLPFPSYQITCCCDGILCLNSRNDHTVSLWNPSTTEYRLLPLPDYPEYFEYDEGQVFCGFGYCSSINDYKVVRVSSICTRRRRPPYPSSAVDVLTLKSNFWTRVHYKLPYLIFYKQQPNSIDGCLYWIAKDHKDHPCLGLQKIIKFDLADDTIIEVEVPPDLKDRHCYLSSLGILGDSLSLATCALPNSHVRATFSPPPTQIDSNVIQYIGYCNIWLMKDGNWMKFIIIPDIVYKGSDPLTYLTPLCFTSDNHHLLMHATRCYRKEVIIYDLKHETRKSLDVGIQDWNQLICYSHGLGSLAN